MDAVPPPLQDGPERRLPQLVRPPPSPLPTPRLPLQLLPRLHDEFNRPLARQNAGHRPQHPRVPLEQLLLERQPPELVKLPLLWPLWLEKTLPRRLHRLAETDKKALGAAPPLPEVRLRQPDLPKPLQGDPLQGPPRRPPLLAIKRELEMEQETVLRLWEQVVEPPLPPP